MSKKGQLIELIGQLFTLFEINYDEGAAKRRCQDQTIIVSALEPDSISKIKDIVLGEGLVDRGDYEENKFFRFVIGKFEEDDEHCSKVIEILAKKFMPHLAAVCPVSDDFLHRPFEYIKELPSESYEDIGLCFDTLDYVLRN